jgi:ABC-2 type transport system ATP-binding protein
MTLGPAIEISSLVKRFDGFTAVEGLDLSVSRGEVFGLLGPNGAGKTTTIRVLLGLMRPTSGTALVLGLDSVRQAREIHSRVGYMSQLFTLYRDLTAEENIRFYGRVYGLSRSELAAREHEVIRMAGLTGHGDQLATALSGGWRQRLALGCAILHHPQVLFLDEPTAGVDPVSRRDFWELINRLAREGITVFVTTHYMDEAEHCQRVGFMHRGRLVALGSPAELKEQHMSGEVLEIRCQDAPAVVRGLQRARAESRLEIGEVSLYGAEVHVLVRDATAATAQISSWLRGAGCEVQSIAPIEPSLEDVFISVVERTRPVSRHSPSQDSTEAEDAEQ